ncbi:MAG TPA: hypothetical protein VI278_04315 [Nitrososphaeraceae archaeon]|jgi:hypothetical protein
MGIVVEHEEREDVERVPVCDEPYRPPLLNLAHHIDESHYKMENRMYIENAD